MVKTLANFRSGKGTQKTYMNRDFKLMYEEGIRGSSERPFCLGRKTGE